jgi:UDP:flavonoid glycosyltransferase YjiC (YdhE family)
VLLTGVHGEGTTLATDVFAFAYAPFSQLFSRVEAVVHHGGIGTAAQALRAGRPQLAVPYGFDQFDNAERLVRLRVARPREALHRPNRRRGTE